jgi:hypothetical protein
MTHNRSRQKKSFKILYPLSEKSAELIQYLNLRRRLGAAKEIPNKAKVERLLFKMDQALIDIDSLLEFFVNGVLDKVGSNWEKVSAKELLHELVKEVKEHEGGFFFQMDIHNGFTYKPIAKNLDSLPWQLAYHLKDDLLRHPERLKICLICKDFFWNGTNKNNNRNICYEESCRKAMNLQRVIKSDPKRNKPAAKAAKTVSTKRGKHK